MSIVKHEATQIDAAQQQEWFKGMQLDADNAVTKQDPVSLARTIDSINHQNQVLNDHQGKSQDDPIRELTSNKFVGQSLNNSMTANLKSNGGDPTQFQSTLERLHNDGKINDTVYDNAAQRLDKLSKSIVAQNQIAVKTQTVNSRMSTISAALQNKLDFSNPNTLSEISANDPKLGEALDNYSRNKNANIKDEDDNFADATEKIFSAGSKEQISNYAINVLKQGNVSQDRLNILVGAAMDRGKNLSDLENQSKSSNPIQNSIDSGMKALFGWNKEQGGHDGQTYADYMNSIKQGQTAQEAYTNATNAGVIRKRPDVVTIPETGKMMIDKNGNRAMVYSDGHYEEMNGKSPKKENE